MKYAYQSVSRIFAFFLLCFACATAVFSASSPTEFYGAKAYAHGGTFYYNTISDDFDGDKIPDVLTVSDYDVVVFYGDGKGGFFPPRIAFSFSSHELYPVAGDFNGDGKADIVYPSRNPVDNQTALAVRFGKADRTFTALTYTNQERTALEIVPVDFDSDGKLDLLVPYAEYNNAAIIFYKNSGAGVFTVGGQLTLSNSPGGIQPGDFDNDGLIDFVFSDSESQKIVRNLGNGAFGAPIVLPNSDYPINSKVVGDVNNDGKADIVAVENYSVDPYVTVWLGNGNFTFTEKPDFTVDTRETVYISRIADINGDNRADLIYGSRNRVIVSYGRGDGTFEPEDSYIDGGGGDVIVADLNGDKQPDIISNQPIEFKVAGSGSFVVLINRNGILRSAPAIPTGDDFKDIAVGDLNADGLKDFVVINRGGGGGPGDVIVVRQTRVDGLAKSETRLIAVVSKGGGSAGIDPASVVIGDFNADGKKDIIVVGHGAYGAAKNALLLINQGSDNFSPTLFAIGTGDIYSAAAADFNSDGKLDLVTTGYAGTLVSNGVGNGTFAAPVGYFDGVPSSVLAVEDYNGDGRADIAVLNYTTSKISLLLSSSGAFVASGTPVISGGILSIAAADMNSDGRTDLIIARGSGVAVMINNGGGTFGGELSYQLTTGTANDLSVADFDGDGKPDVAVTSGSNNITVLLNNGSGALGRETIWGGGAVLAGIAADDLNNDGKPDLIFGFSSSSTGYTKILFNLTDASQNARRPTEFDFDGDGRADAAIFRPSGGVWHLLQSQAGYAAFSFGVATDKIVAADYDGDRRTDIAVFRQGIWHIQRSNLGYTAIQFGADGDVPVPADYDGDGKTDAAVYRRGVWHILGSANGYAAIQFGTATDKPVSSDYDGDGRADLAVYRAGIWHILRSSAGYTALSFGIATDKPVPADYDGDGRADIAVYRDGVWYQLFSANNQFAAFQFGVATDAPAPADYDGDGKTDAAVYRQGIWFISGSTSGLSVINFGLGTDQPVLNAFIK